MAKGSSATVKIADFLERISDIGLKVGLPVFIGAFAYLMILAFGKNISDMEKMTPQQLVGFVNSAALAAKALKISGVIVVGACVLRFMSNDSLGHYLSVGGAGMYFGVPILFANFISHTGPSGSRLVGEMIIEFRTVGGIFLVPGLILIAKDAVERIWIGVSVKRVIEKRWGNEEERKKKNEKPKLYGPCWTMPFCRDFVRQVCPAYQLKKPCWRIKVGCYCDEKTILRAMMANGGDPNNPHAKGIMQSLGMDGSADKALSAKLKKERCRRCVIYAEHQRQKYRILSPAVFPAVVGLMYLYYDRIAVFMTTVLGKADKFMSYLTSKAGGGSEAFQTNANMLTLLGVIWLGVIILSYALKALEYLVFELQV